MTGAELAALGSLVPWLGSVAIIAALMRWAVTRGDALADRQYRILLEDRNRVAAERDALNEAWLTHRARCPLYDDPAGPARPDSG